MPVGVIVINDNPEVDMAWQTDLPTAERMVRWLQDHRVDARLFTSFTAWEHWSAARKAELARDVDVDINLNRGEEC